MSRTAQVFAILIGGGVLLLVLAAGGAWWWWKTHSAELIESAKTIVQEGRAEGARLDESGCLELALERHRKVANPSFTEAMSDSIRLTACLHASKRRADFCTDVPGRDHPLDYGNWANKQCLERGFKDPYCGALMQSVSAYCESPQRADKH